MPVHGGFPVGVGQQRLHPFLGICHIDRIGRPGGWIEGFRYAGWFSTGTHGKRVVDLACQAYAGLPYGIRPRRSEFGVRLDVSGGVEQGVVYGHRLLNRVECPVVGVDGPIVVSAEE